jgi:3-keto-disaccharide hydrolase
MLRHAALLLALLLPGTPRSPNDAIQGRWDITITTPDGPRPSWLEVERSGRETLVGRFVGIVGSARPISRVVMSGDSLRFAIPPQWEEGAGDLSVEGRVDAERLTGSITFPDGKRYDWTAVRAPSLRRQMRPTWGATVPLLNQNDLGGWHAVGSANQWIVTDGILRSPKSGANLVTDRTFGDFRLHVEFRYPKESNSGVYLRGRHEVQIEDNFGMEPTSHRLGGVYGFIEPSEMAAKPPGEWQTYDITLVGRMVTVVANGKTVIFDREIPGITGGALDSNEGAPGPLMLQGDHGPIEYRNITVTQAK